MATGFLFAVSRATSLLHESENWVLSRYRLNLFVVLAAFVTTVAAGQEPTPAPANPPTAPRAVAPRVQPPKPITQQPRAEAPEQGQKPVAQRPATAQRPAEP